MALSFLAWSDFQIFPALISNYLNLEALT